MNAGFTISSEFDKAIKDKKILTHIVHNQQAAVLLLFKTNYDDAFVANKVVTYYSINTLPEYKEYANKLTFLPKSIKKKRGAFMVVSKRSKRIKNIPEMVQKLTKVLKKLEDEGYYDKVISLHTGIN